MRALSNLAAADTILAMSDGRPDNCKATGYPADETRRGFGYYLDKLGVLGLGSWSRYRRYGGAVHTNANPDLTTYDAVVLHLDDPLMHLGDQFYFKPLTVRLPAFHPHVIVRPRKHLEFFFPGERLEHPAGARILVVSRLEVAPGLPARYGKGYDFFLFDTMARSVDRPIADFILHTVADYFGATGLQTPIGRRDFVDFEVADFDEPALRGRERVLVFGNYVESGKFRITPRRRRALVDGLRARKTPEDFVVHVGTVRDKEKDPADYAGLVDLDLRGRTSIPDLFGLVSMDAVQGVYGHDTAILHIASFFDKPIKVVCKKYFWPGQQRWARRCYMPIFAKDPDLVEDLLSA